VGVRARCDLARIRPDAHGHDAALTGDDHYDRRNVIVRRRAALFDIVNVQIWPAAPRLLREPLFERLRPHHADAAPRPI
jgi:hypothetical protein